MKRIYLNTFPSTENQVRGANDPIFITADATHLDNQNSYVVCVDSAADLQKMVRLASEEAFKVKRVVSLNSSEVMSWLDLCFDTRTGIYLCDRDETIDAAEMKSELGRQLIRARFTDARFVKLRHIAQLFADKIPFDYSIEEAVQILMSFNGGLYRPQVEAAITSAATNMEQRVISSKSISHLSTKKVDSLANVAQDILRSERRSFCHQESARYG